MEAIKQHQLMVFVLVGFSFCISVESGITSRYVRRVNDNVDMPMDSGAFYVPPGYNAPQQVHITQGDYEGTAVIVSWITPSEPGTSIVLYGPEESKYTPSEPGTSIVLYGPEESKYTYAAYGTMTKYMYYNYTSGFIHHCTLRNLEFDTKYFYKIGIGNTTREFHFTTSPAVGPDVPYTFGIIGDLGQTYDSNKTLQHYLKTNGQTLLYVGDLSYADNYPFHDNRRWDTWGRLIEKSAAYQPWIWTAGNHEIDLVPEIYRYSNVAYNINNGKCTPIFNPAAPVYLTVGDGGNIEGLSSNFTEPQPSYSAFREASFGHGILEIKNRTHAYFKWHRNEDSYAVVADSKWLYNRYWYHQKKSKLTLSKKRDGFLYGMPAKS